LRQVWN